MECQLRRDSSSASTRDWRICKLLFLLWLYFEHTLNFFWFLLLRSNKAKCNNNSSSREVEAKKTGLIRMRNTGRVINSLPRLSPRTWKPVNFPSREITKESPSLAKDSRICSNLWVTQQRRSAIVVQFSLSMSSTLLNDMTIALTQTARLVHSQPMSCKKTHFSRIVVQLSKCTVRSAKRFPILCPIERLSKSIARRTAVLTIVAR